MQVRSVSYQSERYIREEDRVFCLRKEAEKDIKRAIKRMKVIVERTNPEPWMFEVLCILLSLDMNWEQVVEMSEKRLREYPKEGVLRDLLSNAYLVLGDFRKALAIEEESCRLLPECPVSLRRLLLFKFVLGRPLEALIEIGLLKFGVVLNTKEAIALVVQSLESAIFDADLYRNLISYVVDLGREGILDSEKSRVFLEGLNAFPEPENSVLRGALDLLKAVHLHVLGEYKQITRLLKRFICHQEAGGVLKDEYYIHQAALTMLAGLFTAGKVEGWNQGVTAAELMLQYSYPSSGQRVILDSLIRHYVDAKNWGKASYYAEALLEQDPNNEDALVAVVFARLQLERLDERTFQFARHAYSLYPSQTTWLGYVISLNDCVGAYEPVSTEAENYLKYARLLDDESRASVLDRILLACNRAGRGDLINLIIQYFPEDFEKWSEDSERIASFEILQFHAAIGRGDFEEAKRWLKKARSKIDSDPEVAGFKKGIDASIEAIEEHFLKQQLKGTVIDQPKLISARDFEKAIGKSRPLRHYLLRGSLGITPRSKEDFAWREAVDFWEQFYRSCVSNSLFVEGKVKNPYQLTDSFGISFFEYGLIEGVPCARIELNDGRIFQHQLFERIMLQHEDPRVFLNTVVFGLLAVLQDPTVSFLHEEEPYQNFVDRILLKSYQGLSHEELLQEIVISK